MKFLLCLSLILVLMFGCQADTSSLVLPDNFEEVSREAMYIGLDLYGLIVNGQVVLYMEDRQSLDEVLEGVKEASYIDGVHILSHDIVENVQIKQEKVDIFDKRIKHTSEEALDYILYGKEEPVFHTVEKGDNFWDIAMKYNLTVQDLLDMNRDIGSDNIEDVMHIGDDIMVFKRQPYLTTMTVTREYVIDIIPFTRAEDVPTDDYYRGEYKIKQEGVPGQAELVLEVYYKNGIAFESKEISRLVTLEPVEVIYFMGTKLK